ncbi:hypothetical protein JRO89_XS05G0224400 [Xanthoceras sorbifolium]|uniref:Amino acid transporter transmembrane domain-containing protein n=1 Tax=Xanthoceras sorbifolium TaxID=99658 RepID=A0ABQ8I2U7_9ROSI|nr:hypothetical protein JRO89_XS05G0224400 [Xanthoceras sorbifolium]
MGSIILFSVAVLTYYCMMLLVLTRRRLETPHVFSKIASFGDLGFAVCGSISRLSVDVIIVLAHAGFCISYLIFIGNTLVYVFNNSEESYSHKILGFFTPKFLYIWGCFPFLLRLKSIPTLIHLAPLSIFADVVDLGAIGVNKNIYEEIVGEKPNYGGRCHDFLGVRPVLKAFGDLSIFSYGIGVAIMPLKGSA